MPRRVPSANAWFASSIAGSSSNTRPRSTACRESASVAAVSSRAPVARAETKLSRASRWRPSNVHVSPRTRCALASTSGDVVNASAASACAEASSACPDASSASAPRRHHLRACGVVRDEVRGPFEQLGGRVRLGEDQLLGRPPQAFDSTRVARERRQRQMARDHRRPGATFKARRRGAMPPGAHGFRQVLIERLADQVVPERELIADRFKESRPYLVPNATPASAIDTSSIVVRSSSRPVSPSTAATESAVRLGSPNARKRRSNVSRSAGLGGLTRAALVRRRRRRCCPRVRALAAARWRRTGCRALSAARRESTSRRCSRRRPRRGRPPRHRGSALTAGARRSRHGSARSLASSGGCGEGRKAMTTRSPRSSARREMAQSVASVARSAQCKSSIASTTGPSCVRRSTRSRKASCA